MTRPTPREAEEMRIRKLVKDIWENDCARKKDELVGIGFNDDKPNFTIIRTDKASIEIHRSSFEDYFNSRSEEQKKYARDSIKKFLEQLLQN